MGNISGRVIASLISVLGCRQVVRHRILVPAFGGSNPPTPATIGMHSAAFVSRCDLCKTFIDCSRLGLSS